MCVACSAMADGALCERCEMSLRPASGQYLAGVGVVRSAFRHRGAARLLVHHLKYRGVVKAGRLLAGAMAEHVPAGAVLVPVRRVGWRQLRYGVDPALELAKALTDLTGSPVVSELVAPFWGKARAGRVHGFAPRFRRRRELAGHRVILLDDVITTGATLAAAAYLFPGVDGAVTATTSAITSRVRAGDTGLTSLADGGSAQGVRTWR